jgi:hypothetical protein
MNHLNGLRAFQHCVVIISLSVMLFILIEIAFCSYFDQWANFTITRGWCINYILVFVGFLNDNQLRELQVSSIFLYGSFISCFISIAVSSLIVWFVRIRNFDYSPFTHINGPILLKNNAAAKHFRKNSKSEGRKGLSLHPNIFIPIIREAGNIFVWGMQGLESLTLLNGWLNS